MPSLIWESRPDGLRAPALVCAFTGWNDAGDAASAALQFVGSSLGATRFARIDPEEFYDFQATRPTIRLTEGQSREIEWPEVEIYAARVPRAPRDLILLQGPEPSMRWRTFMQQIIDIAEALGVQMVVTLGALLADVPHTRPVPTIGFASDEALVERLGLQPSNYEGPTGHHRRDHRRLPGRGHALRLALGERAALRGRGARTRRPRSRSCASSRGSSGCRSTRRSSSPTRPATRPRSPPPSPRTRTSRPSSSAWRPPRSRRRPRPTAPDVPERRRPGPRVPAVPAPAGPRARLSGGQAISAPDLGT